MAAEGTAELIDAPYQFAVLVGGGHHAADQMPEQVTVGRTGPGQGPGTSLADHRSS